jgi:hypothetical protein
VSAERLDQPFQQCGEGVLWSRWNRAARAAEHAPEAPVGEVA